MSTNADTSAFELTADGKAKWSNNENSPTQAELVAFVNINREKLTSLFISVSHGRGQPILNFEDIGVLPSLESLILGGVHVAALAFKTANTPALRLLNFSHVSCSGEDGLRLELDLPQLRTLKAEHVMVDGPCDFGLSLSRCPMLEEVSTYKVADLSGDNFAILPNCKSLTLHHSDSTENLEVLSAPKLELLSVQASYYLWHVRLWDVPYEVNVKDVEQLVKSFKRKPDAKKVSQAAKAAAVEQLLQELSARPVVHPQDSLPRCTVTCVNMSLSDESREHLVANKRVTVVGELTDDDLF